MLVSPEGIQTRPTSDRAKESLFNILDSKVQDARVLDIFCGSGAIGIEALSRGAKDAVFIDNARLACRAVSANLIKTGLSKSGEVIVLPADSAVSILAEKERVFDIIFMDPPYESDLLPVTLGALAKNNILAEDGLIIVETDSAASEPESIFRLTDTRKYGRTKFLFLMHIGISRFEKAGRDEVIHNMKNKWGKKSNEKKA